MLAYFSSFCRHLRGDGHKVGVFAARLDAACWLCLFIALVVWGLS